MEYCFNLNLSTHFRVELRNIVGSGLLSPISWRPSPYIAYLPFFVRCLVNMFKVVHLFFKTPPILPTLPLYGKNLGVRFQAWGALSHLKGTLYNNCQQFPTITYFSSQRAPSWGHIGLELNIVTWSTKTLKGGTPSMIKKKLILLDALKMTFQRFYCIKLSFMHLLWNGLNRVNFNSLK